MKYSNAWFILPAGCLFSQTKVKLEDLPKQWQYGTVVICEKPNGQYGFICGASGHYADPGTKHECRHDQTRMLIGSGDWTVLDEVTFKTVEGQVSWTSSSIQGIFDKKATLHVFK